MFARFKVKIISLNPFGSLNFGVLWSLEIPKLQNSKISPNIPKCKHFRAQRSKVPINILEYWARNIRIFGMLGLRIYRT